MATKEDILEQLVEEFLIHRGYFVRHNVKFLPRKDHAEFSSRLDSNHSDIDVLGYNPLIDGPDRVWAVSCKSWQAGFDPVVKIAEIEKNKIVSGREAWKTFRELQGARGGAEVLRNHEGSRPQLRLSTNLQPPIQILVQCLFR